MSTDWTISKSVHAFCHGWKNWLGSHYELGFAYTNAFLEQDTRSHLLQCVWDDPNLLGVVFDPDAYGEPWQPAHRADTSDGRHVYGYIRLAPNRITGCGSFFSSYQGETWLVLYIPVGMVQLIYPVQHPIKKENNPWMVKVDTVFAEIGTRLYREFPFTLGVMGEEASGSLDWNMTHLEHDPQLLVPESLFKRKGVAPHGVRSPEELWWTGGKNKNKETGAS